MLGRAGELLADDGPHASAAEAEVHHGERHGKAPDRALAPDESVGKAGLGLILSKLRSIAGKAQGVAAAHAGVVLAKGALVRGDGDAFPGREASVVAAVSADMEILLHLGLVEHVAALGTLGPEAVGDGLARPALAARLAQPCLLT